MTQQKGRIRASLELNKAPFSKSLKEAVKESVEAAAKIRAAFNEPLKLPAVPPVTLPPPVTIPRSPRVGSDPALKEQRDQVTKYRNELARLNAVYEDDRDRKKYSAGIRALRTEMEGFRKTVKDTSPQLGILDRAIGQSIRSLNTAESRVSALGLSQQILIGTNARLATSLVSSGGIAGGPATLGITAYGGALAGASLGASVLSGGLLAVGAGTAALVARGVPQVKSFQQSLNILSVSGAKDLDKLDATLADLQDEAGRAGQQFSRAELAAALADTVKAGVDADTALTILKESLKLAAAEGTSLTESTSLVLKAIRQYQLGAEDAAVVTDRLAQAGLLAASNTTEISTGLSRVAGTGRAAGVEMSDLIGMIVELDNAGLEASDRGANALNSALAAIANMTPQARRQLAAWNIEVNNSDGTARLAGDILADLGDKLRLNGVQYDANTDSLTGNGDALRGLSQIMGTEGARAVLNLTGAWRGYSEQIENSEGVSERYSDTLTQGLEPAQKRLKAALDDAGKSAATIFAPGMEKAADALAAVARQADRLKGFELPTAGQVGDFVTGAGGVEQLETAQRDLERAREQLQLLQKEREKLAAFPTTERGPGLPGIIAGILQTDQGELDNQLETQDRQIAAFEAQVKKAQARIAALTGPPKSGGGRKDDGFLEPLPLLVKPPPPVDPAVQAEYEAALRNAQDAATAAQIAAMEQGAVRVEAQRRVDLGAAKRAFDETAILYAEQPKKLAALTAAYNTQVLAINQGANTQLEQLASDRLQTAQALRQSLDDAAAQLAQDQAGLASDPLRAIGNSFQTALRTIERDTAELLRTAESAYQDGALSRAEYEAEVLRIGQIAAGRQKLAGEQRTQDERAELERRAEVIRTAQQNIAALRSSDTAADQRSGGDEAGALKTEIDAELAVIRSGLQEQLQVEGQGEAQKQALRDEARARELSATNGYNRSLADLDKQRTDAARQEAEASAQALSAATIANIDGGIPQLIASFAEERRVRQDAFNKRLEESKADGSARAQLITDFNRAELELGFAHNREVKTQQETALKSYLEAVKTYQKELKVEREKAAQQEVANETALNQARQNGVNQRLEAARKVASDALERSGGSDNLPEQIAANQALLSVLEEGVRVAQLATQAARDRKAEAEEIVTLLGSEAQAQQAVTQAIQSNIDALKQQRSEAEAVIGTGGQLVSLMQNVNEITGASLDRGEVLKGLEAEENALVRQLRLLESQDAGLGKIAEKTRQIAENQKAQNDAGGNAQLSGSEQRTVNRAAADAVAEFDSNVFSAERKVRELNEQIALSSAELVTATSKLTDLLDTAASDEGLNFEVKVKVDRKQLDEAKKALREAFGAEAGDRIIRQAEQAGAKGGKGLASAFATGLLNGRALIRNAVETVLREDVRAFLPSSDAKRGPLNSLTANGVSLVRTIGVGMMRERSGLSRISESIAAAARPALSVPAIPTSRPVYGAPGAASPNGGGMTIEKMFVNGAQQNPSGMTEMAARNLLQQTTHEAFVRYQQEGG